MYYNSKHNIRMMLFIQFNIGIMRGNIMLGRRMKKRDYGIGDADSAAQSDYFEGAVAEEKKREKLLRVNKAFALEDNGVVYKFLVDDADIIASNGEMMDGALWNSRFAMIADALRTSLRHDKSKYCYIPKGIDVHFHKENVRDMLDKSGENVSADTVPSPADDSSSAEDCGEVVSVREPRWSFEDIYIEPEKVKTIERALLIAQHKDILFEQWKLGNGDASGRAIVLNFFGPPGTGKSMTGEAIARLLSKKVYSVNYSELESKYVGETPKNIVKIFKQASQNDAVIIFDEADSFLGKRLTNVSQSADYGVNITRSVMLMELEKFDGIVIFTTNLISNYDEAFKRRILASIEFSLPDVAARERIWEIYLNRGMSLEGGITAKVLAEKYPGISGADIKDILLFAAVSALQRNAETIVITAHDFDDAYAVIKKRSEGSSPASFSIKHETISKEEYEAEMGDGQC